MRSFEFVFFGDDDCFMQSLCLAAHFIGTNLLARKDSLERGAVDFYIYVPSRRRMK